jgi:hypothetical protein
MDASTRSHGSAGARTCAWLGLVATLAYMGCASAEPTPTSPEPSLVAPAQAGGGSAPTVRRLARQGWVEVSAEVVASESEAPAAARERALADARRAAVEAVAGIRVQSSLVSFEGVRGADASSLVQTLTASRADALVLDEKLVGTQLIPLPQTQRGYRLRVLMRARVLDRSRATDPGFQIEVQLDRERFLAGEDVALSVRASRDSRIYVLGISENGAALLLPNQWLPDTRADAGEWLRFPGRDLRERGVRLTAQVPDGRKSATEALVVVALRGDRTLQGLAPSSGRAFRDSDAQGAGVLLAELLTPLSELPPDSWAFDQVVYEIYAR